MRGPPCTGRPAQADGARETAERPGSCVVGQRSAGRGEHVKPRHMVLLAGGEIACQGLAGFSCSGTRRLLANFVSCTTIPSSVMSFRRSANASEIRRPVAASRPNRVA